MERQIRVTMENEGGELDSRVVNSESKVKAALLELVAECSYLQPGDVFRVAEVEQ